MVKKVELTAQEILDVVDNARKNSPTIHSVRIEHKIVPIFATLELCLDHWYDNDEEVWDLFKTLFKRSSDWELKRVLRRRLPNV